MAIDTQSRGLRVVTSDDQLVLDFELIQGMFSEAQYLKMTAHSRRLLEFADGAIEVLPMPTRRHQLILGFLYLAFHAFLTPRGGLVLFAAFRLRIRGGKFREPDLLLLVEADDPRNQDDYWRGADVVVEVVSPDDPEWDTVVKRRDYAEARVPEYWIVNPMDETLIVLRLEGEHYVEHGVFRRGDTASSALLEGFSLDVSAVFDAG